MNTEELKIWLDKPEGDHHDFKEHWYHKGQKPELVKDIFSFVNTVHHDDCLLILGVNDQRKVTGVEDDENWRLNQQQLIDFMRKLPISGELIPRLGVETIHIGEHEVDVIRIFNSNNVPVFLGRKWNEKGLPNNVILPGQIFTREQDVNTARDSTADYHQVERLFKKHFRMDTPIEERYKYTLSDTSNWRYTEADGFVFQYSPNPDFYMVLCDDDEDRYKAEAYSLDQFRTKMSWQSLKIKFRQSAIDTLLVVWLDGGRLVVVKPDVGILRSDSSRPLSYYCLIENTIAGRVQNLFATGLPLTADPYSLNAFYKSVVLFRSEDEKNNLESLLVERIDDVESLIKPTEDEITGIAGRMAMDFKSTEQEVQDTTISYMLVQHAMGRLMNDCLLDYRRGNDISGVISRWRQKRTEG
ncbi:AlbA family DNA-binding domain-containing protein [Lacticaseibacillus rhamnosus]|uniref:AlbA family DNA-binding domain-containing protein n=1 Tax=Lacticaseibacillus rhamnosus TaxID=47715 RepID=UPI00023249AB|nr:ATP-binding protein [Lacticaseibacillus rhamnosus]AER64708.1 divergent AAA domain protein [Lacticaseibacillus rhamnosus ATCC 8530]